MRVSVGTEGDACVGYFFGPNGVDIRKVEVSSQEDGASLTAFRFDVLEDPLHQLFNLMRSRITSSVPCLRVCVNQHQRWPAVPNVALH